MAATWNLMSWMEKKHEFLQEPTEHKVDISTLNETRKKGKEKLRVRRYIMIYSRAPMKIKERWGVGVLKHENFEKISKCRPENFHIISVYALDISKSREKREKFYNNLQIAINKIPTNERAPA
ncbi:hypothetical protein ABEB36_011356 [Hypothenemus hampei]|uniref:Uncharacterized protein n=1 Tax=Hypothenemus hampei TaxID=57062 RepID=A0ABD1EF64_HYPHA